MSTYLALLFQEIWQWILAPPLHWAQSLSLEWQLELGGLLFAALFHRRIVEYSVISGQTAREWWAERRRLHEWYYYGSMNESEFLNRVDALRQDADHQERLAERLEEHGAQGFRGDILRGAAIRRQQQAERLREQARRLERLWKAIEKERSGPGNKIGMRKKVLGLTRDLVSGNRAEEALAELNRIAGWFDWEILAPAGMSPPERELLVHWLTRMARAESVKEAWEAYDRAHRLLEQNNAEWEWDLSAA